MTEITTRNKLVALQLNMNIILESTDVSYILERVSMTPRVLESNYDLPTGEGNAAVPASEALKSRRYFFRSLLNDLRDSIVFLYAPC